MLICVFIWGGSSITVDAAEVMKTSKLTNSVRNIEVSNVNSMLDIITEFTPEIVAEIEQYQQQRI